MSETTPDNQTENTEPERDNPASEATGTITDDQLPEDLQPTDDNPLAKPPGEDGGEDSGMKIGPEGPAS